MIFKPKSAMLVHHSSKGWHQNQVEYIRLCWLMSALCWLIEFGPIMLSGWRLRGIAPYSEAQFRDLHISSLLLSSWGYEFFGTSKFLIPKGTVQRSTYNIIASFNLGVWVSASQYIKAWFSDFHSTSLLVSDCGYEFDTKVHFMSVSMNMGHYKIMEPCLCVVQC